MNSMESVVITADGESKCGKTEFITQIATEATFQRDVVPNFLENDKTWDAGMIERLREPLMTLYEMGRFSGIHTISAGNMFRAASLYKSLSELDGPPMQSFGKEDVDPIRAMLATPGIEVTLQTDPNVGSKVSEVAQMVGAQILCSTIFCDAVMKAYDAKEGGSLVIIDARDPIGHLRRNDRIGRLPGQVNSASILPLYIETPVEIAASRMRGNFAVNVAEVIRRRHLDATRIELPVVPPTELIEGFPTWALQFDDLDRQEPAIPLHTPNDNQVALDNIQFLAGVTAALAQNLGLALRNQRVS